jgi:hypothetical protein
MSCSEDLREYSVIFELMFEFLISHNFEVLMKCLFTKFNFYSETVSNELHKLTVNNVALHKFPFRS